MDLFKRSNSGLLPSRSKSGPAHPLEIEQDLALVGGADQALRPGHRHLAGAAGHRRHPVQHGRGIDDRRAGRQLVADLAAGGVHHQLAPVVVLGLGEEERDRDVRAHLVRPHHGVVHVGAELHARRVAGEKRRREAPRQHRRRKDAVRRQRGDHLRLRLLGGRPGAELLVLLDQPRRPARASARRRHRRRRRGTRAAREAGRSRMSAMQRIIGRAVLLHGTSGARAARSRP